MDDMRERMGRIEIKFDNAEKVIEEMRATSARDIAEMHARSERAIEAMHERAERSIEAMHAKADRDRAEMRSFSINSRLAMAGVVIASIALISFWSAREHDRFERESAERARATDRHMENIENLIRELHGRPAVRTSAER